MRKRHIFICVPFAFKLARRCLRRSDRTIGFSAPRLSGWYGSDAEHSPYDVRYLKTVAAKCGAFRRKIDGQIVYETGGLAYDEKRFTRFGRVLFGDWEGVAVGVTPVRADEVCAALEKLLLTDGCALLTGRAAATAVQMMLLLAGVKAGDACARLTACGAQAEQKSAAQVRAFLAERFSEEEISRLAGILQ